MKQVPYHDNPGNACALACYTMVAQYLMPDANITFEQLAEIADWKPGYVVWGFPVWKWLMDRGVNVTDMDVIDYAAWAKNGLEGLKKSVSRKEFEYYRQNTYNLGAESKRASLMMDHPNFTYIHRAPAWADVESEFLKPGICDITLNLRMLNHQMGFAAHRVVLTDITEDEVVFHDPNRDGDGANRRENKDHFRKSFAYSPEIARYALDK